MKKFLFSLLLSFPFLFAQAAPVLPQQAEIAALNFLHSRANSASLRNVAALNLAYTATGTPGNGISSSTALFYAFNVQPSGFILISADDRAMPVLGYSDVAGFNAAQLPPNVAKWLQEYKNQMLNIIANNIQATTEIQDNWNSLSAASSAVQQRSPAAVNPLLQTTWDQSPYYNALCPGGSVTGCVATAMAQIMKYWNYPAQGTGFHSYNHATYGTLSANFSSTSYQWSSMPNNVSSSNTAVATLMYHCGVSVEMDYSPQSSGAFVINSQSPVQNCAEYAFETYFGYQSSLSGVERVNYSQTAWMNLVKNELDNNRPILYAGFGSGGGHAFVADGYDNNDFVHFNWGWGGYYDGYFGINALNPGGTGTGGGTGGYNTGHQAVIGIQPPASTSNPGLQLSMNVTPSANPILFTQGFSVTTDLLNNTGASFSGDLCAALFDLNGVFIDFVQIVNGVNISAGASYPGQITFTNAGLVSALPGDYLIGIFYRTSGGNWMQVSDGPGYTNLVPFSVVNPNDIEVYSTITVTPGTTVVQGQNIDVNFNIANDGASTFFGLYSADIFDLNGTYIATINEYNETNGLPAGYIYNSPYITLSGTVTVPPGTYLLAILHNDGSGWQLTGSSYYSNPIYLTVVAPALSPDVYENNNTQAQSYTFTPSFSGNNANVNTTGSNLHTVSDNDYYKVNLAPGFDYTIDARAHDSYSSTNGNTYTVDALWSYSTDGTNWMGPYDDVMPGTIQMIGGGTLYIRVAPYFAGEMGTYLIDMNIQRNLTTSLTSLAQNTFSIYPNPTSDQLNIQLNDNTSGIFNIVNMSGAVLTSQQLISQSGKISIDCSNFASGIYFIEVITEGKVNRERFVISR